MGASIIKKDVAQRNLTEAFVDGVQPLFQGNFFLSNLDELGAVRKLLGVAGGQSLSGGGDWLRFLRA